MNTISRSDIMGTVRNIGNGGKMESDSISKMPIFFSLLANVLGVGLGKEILRQA